MSAKKEEKVSKKQESENKKRGISKGQQFLKKTIYNKKMRYEEITLNLYPFARKMKELPSMIQEIIECTARDAPEVKRICFETGYGKAQISTELKKYLGKHLLHKMGYQMETSGNPGTFKNGFLIQCIIFLILGNNICCVYVRTACCFCYTHFFNKKKTKTNKRVETLTDFANRIIVYPKEASSKNDNDDEEKGSNNDECEKPRKGENNKKKNKNKYKNESKKNNKGEDNNDNEFVEPIENESIYGRERESESESIKINENVHTNASRKRNANRNAEGEGKADDEELMLTSESEDEKEKEKEEEEMMESFLYRMQDLTVSRVDKKGDDHKLDRLYNIPAKYFKPQPKKQNNEMEQNQKYVPSYNNNGQKANWEDVNCYNVKEQQRILDEIERQKSAMQSHHPYIQSYYPTNPPEIKQPNKNNKHKNKDNTDSSDDCVDIRAIDIEEQKNIMQNLRKNAPKQNNKEHVENPLKNWSGVAQNKFIVPLDSEKSSLKHDKKKTASKPRNNTMHNANQFKMTDLFKPKPAQPPKPMQPTKPKNNKSKPSQNSQPKSIHQQPSNHHDPPVGHNPNQANLEWVQQLTAMGFSADSILQAIVKTKGTGVNAALEYLLKNSK
ncbi:hypothetical protein RFI_24218 [Reticulomyxa filosa]|uniref:UBA domain-containing protein n=1 Tax=Reticulomyxa filosa TaxID=46433 RepID=X6MGL4_RETFI|nr:hypothetical protein RFI_24218 [Reticulomyxa filosa]|eukprot:ETO13158.1 hypothetical protein RFI_24218 [Reticulomyxa filosa]